MLNFPAVVELLGENGRIMKWDSSQHWLNLLLCKLTGVRVFALEKNVTEKYWLVTLLRQQFHRRVGLKLDVDEEWSGDEFELLGRATESESDDVAYQVIDEAELPGECRKVSLTFRMLKKTLMLIVCFVDLCGFCY